MKRRLLCPIYGSMSVAHLAGYGTSICELLRNIFIARGAFAEFSPGIETRVQALFELSPIGIRFIFTKCAYQACGQGV
jgi:hypothetical protein